MTERTRIIDVRLTYICRGDIKHAPDKEVIAKSIKGMTDADDVQVMVVKDFTMEVSDDNSDRQP